MSVPAAHPSNAARASAWAAVSARAEAEASHAISALFAADSRRFADFSLEIGDIFLDCSKNALSPAARGELLALLAASGFADWREALLAGAPVNASEGRAALHTALRGVGPEAQVLEARTELDRVCALAEAVRAGRMTGASGQAYTDVVNIGIGGSLLGPQMAARALARYAGAGPRVHFVSDPDGCKLRDLIASLNPDTTLFILASKTFTTAETLANAAIARDWLGARLGQAASATSSACPAARRG